MVQTGHGSELAGVDVRRVALSDQGVGVGRVTDNQYLDAAAGNFIDGLALYREDGRVGLQQILALHAGAAGTGTYQQRIISILECNFWIVGYYHASQQRECAVVEFHGNAVQGAQSRGNFQHLQNDRLIGAEHLAGGDPEKQ